MSWEPSVWEVGLVCGWALLTGGVLATLAAQQKHLQPQPVPKPSTKNARSEGEPVDSGAER